MQEKLTHSGILEINLSHLAENYRLFQDKVGPDCAVAGVVKADAYGLGLKPVVEKLDSLNCPQYFVATLDEAVQLRQLNGQSPVAVLGGLFHGAEEDYIAQKITPVLNSPDDISRWQELAKEKAETLSAFLHIDTGMNRLGLSHDETQKIIDDPALLDGIDVKIIMSHFACADEKDHPLTAQQHALFSDVISAFPQSSHSLANSPGLFRSETYHYDLVRPGIGLYGGNPTPETDNPMKPTVSLKSRILQIRHCKKGETIGYGASHKFDRDTMTATIGLGYADGFLRTADRQKTFYYNDVPCPVIGRVSMDLVTIDLSGVKENPTSGEMIEIIGPNQTIDDLAADLGTIPYEILTSLGQRYHREYI
jgi:alanine racemase